MKKQKNNSRKITESLPQSNSKKSSGEVKSPSKWVVFGHEFELMSMVFLSLSFIFLAICLVGMILIYAKEQDKRLAASDNFFYWQEVAQIQKNSPDAYYQAGLYAVELGKNKEAYEFLQKAIELDPEFEKAKKLQKLLESGK